MQPMRFNQMASAEQLRFRRFLPSGTARHFVQCYWCISPERPQNITEKLYPDGGTSVSFIINDGKLRIVLAHYSKTQIVRFDNLAQVFSIRFLPHFAFPLLGLHAEEVNNGEVDITEHLTSTPSPTLIKLMHALTTASESHWITLANQWIDACSLHCTFPKYVISDAVLRRVSIQDDVASLTEKLGMSKRTLERTFRKQLNITPASYLTFLRMMKARWLLSYHALPTAEVALECGFYDQAHFTHVFSRFVSETPRRYHKRKVSHIYNILK
ncbi:helix-turn-helix domain-containing protein [Aestuariibacter sp. AA17]|uniref:Helix-turn-helix domain-containing protein n=1 Tax=Fluctibacter corallii TaxID=2984329 RepID=A0ABT3ACP7_9ALTE|nr:helix-turn-helix domain-containing protein [Aestuariibacter sp. AA17]MCV2886352.1 helix-turn-helix domain-containing protein [Aestuariibacter sp. AA17]